MSKLGMPLLNIPNRFLCKWLDLLDMSSYIICYNKIQFQIVFSHNYGRVDANGIKFDKVVHFEVDLKMFQFLFSECLSYTFKQKSALCIFVPCF